MIRFYEKGIDVIKESFAGANKGIICTPYYTERGLQFLDPFFDAAEEVEFWTRLNPLDWRDGVADMEALKHRVQSVVGRQKKFVLYVSNDLHAKIYSFSNNKAIIGSANLTWSAMTTNIETICELTDDDTASFLPLLLKFRPRLKPLPVDVFLAYVDAARDVISKPSEGIEEVNDEMITAINLAEEILGKSPAHAPIQATLIPSHLEMQNFKDYCLKENSYISNGITERIEGLDNLQGHVKQCFYGTVRFFSEYPNLVDEVAATPNNLLYDFNNQEIFTKWRNFLRLHENEVDTDRGLRFRTLIICLPPSAGGTLTGGGGASPTLKRVFPVVARMLKVSGKNK
jgi:hypothetical protein